MKKYVKELNRDLYYQNFLWTLRDIYYSIDFSKVVFGTEFCHKMGDNKRMKDRTFSKVMLEFFHRVVIKVIEGDRSFIFPTIKGGVIHIETCKKEKEGFEVPIFSIEDKPKSLTVKMFTKTTNALINCNPTTWAVLQECHKRKTYINKTPEMGFTGINRLKYLEVVEEMAEEFDVDIITLKTIVINGLISIVSLVSKDYGVIFKDNKKNLRGYTIYPSGLNIPQQYFILKKYRKNRKHNVEKKPAKLFSRRS